MSFLCLAFSLGGEACVLLAFTADRHDILTHTELPKTEFGFILPVGDPRYDLELSCSFGSSLHSELSLRGVPSSAGRLVPISSDIYKRGQAMRIASTAG